MIKDNIDTNKQAFSLAEGMIMLVVVSVLMAVSVPLITKKTQIDARTLWGHATYRDANNNNFTSTSGGFGNNNRVGIGIKNALAKLHIRDTHAADRHTENDVVFQVDAGHEDDEHNLKAFKVYGDGTTNIPTGCIPDYDNLAEYCTSSDGDNYCDQGTYSFNNPDDFVDYMQAPANGYILSSYCVIVTDNEDDDRGTKIMYCPTVALSTYHHDLPQEELFMGKILVPIQKDYYFKYIGLPDTATSQRHPKAHFHYNRPIGIHFVPCKS